MTSRSGKNKRGARGLVMKSARFSVLRTNELRTLVRTSACGRVPRSVGGVHSGSGRRWPTRCAA
eukprot:5686134-Pleurochrysis_carterae.AAC.1